MEVPTLQLKRIVKKIQHANNGAWNIQISAFLANPPAKSNYLIEEEIDCFGSSSQVCEIFPSSRKSRVPLKEHIGLLGLSSDCVVILTQDQAQTLDNLLYHVDREMYVFGK